MIDRADRDVDITSARVERDIWRERAIYLSIAAEKLLHHLGADLSAAMDELQMRVADVKLLLEERKVH